MSKLQEEFAQSVALLIRVIPSFGMTVTLGEAYRTPEQAKLNAEKKGVGHGISNSLHIERLAIDICLFQDGRYLTRSEDYEQVGEWWESLGRYYRWGGRFENPDGNHFSLSPDGARA